MNDTHIVDCTHDRHAAAILAILNDAIVTSTALYDDQPRPLSAMAELTLDTPAAPVDG